MDISASPQKELNTESSRPTAATHRSSSNVTKTVENVDDEYLFSAPDSTQPEGVLPANSSSYLYMTEPQLSTHYWELSPNSSLAPVSNQERPQGMTNLLYEPTPFYSDPLEQYVKRVAAIEPNRNGRSKGKQKPGIPTYQESPHQAFVITNPLYIRDEEDPQYADVPFDDPQYAALGKIGDNGDSRYGQPQVVVIKSNSKVGKLESKFYICKCEKSQGPRNIV